MTIFIALLACAFIIILFLFTVGAGYLNEQYDKQMEDEFFNKKH